MHGAIAEQARACPRGGGNEGIVLDWNCFYPRSPALSLKEREYQP
jgi:hypothetical protein